MAGLPGRRGGTSAVPTAPLNPSLRPSLRTLLVASPSGTPLPFVFHCPPPPTRSLWRVQMAYPRLNAEREKNMRKKYAQNPDYTPEMVEKLLYAPDTVHDAE